MGWFGSRTGSDAARDADLPLSVEQAQHLRELVRMAWARAGREVTVHSDRVVDLDGGTFGLWNLAVRVSDAPRRRWRRLVDDHVTRLAAPAPDVESLSDSRLRAQLVLRLASDESLADPSWFPTSPVLAGDLRQVLVLDFPDTVITPDERSLAARGDLDEWRAVGRANPWHMMRSEQRQHELVGRQDDGGFEVLVGDSVYTASMAVFLPELLSLVGRADQGRGVLVAMPFRHQVAFRVIDGPDTVFALQNLFTFAMAGFDDGAGPLSPHVYWVRDGRWEQVTTFGEEGPGVVVGDELAAALELPDE